MTIGLRPKRRTGLRISIAVLSAIVVVLFVYRGKYGMWPWNAYPATLHVCGRDFAPNGSLQTRAEAQRTASLVRYGSLPTLIGGEPIWTSAHHGDCGEMWVQGSSNEFKPYTLLGGP